MNKNRFIIILNCLLFLSLSLTSHEYSSLSCGSEHDINRKIFIFKNLNDGNHEIVSPFHGIKLHPEHDKDIVNMVVEIPKKSQKKIEINKSQKYNPLTYDIKDDKIRTISYKARHTNFPGYPFHYGALPQTWEHSGLRDTHTKMFGDNDPVDAFDISSLPAKPGDINHVKVLGAIAMIDNKETDWKLIVINTNDRLAHKYNDITDVPWGIIDTIYDFLLNYKTSEGKPQNEFYKKIYWHKDEALKIISELHHHWHKLCHDPHETAKEIKANRPDKLDEQPRCNHVKKRVQQPACPARL